MKKKNVLVLGSKPDAEFDNFDIAYCANAASSFYKHKLNTGSALIKSIISASELVENKRLDNADKTVWLEDKLPMLTDNSKSKIFLINHNYFPESLSIIKDSAFSGELDLIDSYKLNELQEKVTSYKEPLWTKYHRRTPLWDFLKNLRLFVADKIKYKIDSRYQNSGLFRPSTGIIALIFAIHENGTSAHYEVSGIGIKNRGFYPDGAINTWTPKKKLASFHVYVDRFLCEILSDIYSIRFSDSSMKYLNKTQSRSQN